MTKPTISIDTLVDKLRAAESSAITSSRIAEVLLENRLDEKSLRPYRKFSNDHYTRNLILRDEWFDIMVLCWQPGMGTPIHTHNGQLGWALVTEGTLECTEYRYLGCSSPENQNVAGLDCTAGGTNVKLEPTQNLVATPGNGLNRVDRQVTIHSLAVPHDAKEPTVSLHVYSLPFDSCVVFNQADGGCSRKDLSFDSAPEGAGVRMIG